MFNLKCPLVFRSLKLQRFIVWQMIFARNLRYNRKNTWLKTVNRSISFVDSTPLRVCRNQRILIHKTFEGLAECGKCSMGWFFGFKLHLIINDKGEILNFMFTPGNVDDREPLKQGKFLENIKGKLCADKGYIGQALFGNLFLDGIQLVTKVKDNMKNSLMSIADKILLRKRVLIETINDELKSIAQIEHSRHRSFNNFIANSLSAIAQHTAFLKRSPPLT